MDSCNKCNRPKPLPGKVLTVLCECGTEAGQVDAVVMHPGFEEEKEPPIGDYYFCRIWIGDDSEPEKRIIEWAEFKNVAGGTYMDWDIDPEEREAITKIEWLDEGA